MKTSIRTHEGRVALVTGAAQSIGQAIALAFSSNGLLLIDDRAGRKAARQLGVEVTGVVGVLLEAKRIGHIPMIKPILETIRHHGYWLSDALVETALQIANE